MKVDTVFSFVATLPSIGFWSILLEIDVKEEVFINGHLRLMSEFSCQIIRDHIVSPGSHIVELIVTLSHLREHGCGSNLITTHIFYLLRTLSTKVFVHFFHNCSKEIS